ncbi:MAG: TIGR00725 family protein [Planctomycetota bacterium]
MRTRMVAVVGTGKHTPGPVLELSEKLGAALAKARLGIVSGGLGGVMEAVSRGAFHAREQPGQPPIIGILPGYDADEGNNFLDVVIPSGMGHARNALVAAAGDVVICVGGATGALSEVALARKIGRPVLAFPESGGTAMLVCKGLPSVTQVRTPEEAVTVAKGLLE